MQGEKIFKYFSIKLIQIKFVEYTDCTSAEGLSPRPPINECPVYDTKQSDGQVSTMLELWWMWSTPSLPSLLGLHFYFKLFSLLKQFSLA